MSDSQAARLKPLIYFLTLLLLLAVLVPAVIAWRDGAFESAQSLQACLSAYGILAPLVLTAFQAAQVVLPVLPGFLGCIVGTALFGPAVSFWCNYLGISLGSLAAYWLARWFGMPLVRQLVSLERFQTLSARLRESRRYELIFFAAILLPLAPDDYFCYFSGLMGMRPARFTAIIFAAKPWCILAYCLGVQFFLL